MATPTSRRGPSPAGGAAETAAPGGATAPGQRSFLSPLRRIPDPMFAWLLIIPAMVILLGFSVVPMITTVWTSLQEPGIEASIGPANYERMVSDGVFLQSLRNNLVFSMLTVPISLAIAMLMAVLVNREIRARGFLRMAFFTPAMLPVIAAAAIWLAFYQPNFGLINVIAESVGLQGQNWLGNPSTVLPALMVVMIWKEAGFFMLFYLAGLQTISPELNEASTLEGTGRWTHFRRVTFPLLMPTTLFTSIVGVANSFKQVDFIFVMTQGGPNNASNLLLYNIYLQAFPNRNPEFAAAMTVVLVTILVVLAVIQIRMFDRRIHYR